MGRKRKRDVPEVQVNLHYENGSTEVDVCDINLPEDQSENNENEVLPASCLEDISGGDVFVEQLNDDDSNTSTHSECEGLSRYYQKIQKKQSAWEKMRDGVLKMTFKVNGMAHSSKCILCGNVGCCRCKDCGSMAMYCEECAKQMHTQTNIFHRVEILKNGIFFPLELHRRLTSICLCDSLRHSQSIVVMDLSGAFVEVEIEFCDCQPIFIQLIQFGLWGATPSKPTLAFSIELLELFHAMQMECHVSLKGMYQAYKTFNMSKIVPCSASREIYPVILDSFEEYRLYRHKLVSLTCFLPELDNGDVCPACPKDEGLLFESFDALFIGRRKNAGQSMNDPLFGDLMFYPQRDVDNFVSNYYSSNQQSKKEIEGCHSFLAGDAVRSLHRYKALSETAIFGRGCRHEFPKKFLSLKHGERLAYAVWMVEDMIKVLLEKPNLEIKILYDISCMLVKHLQSRGEDELLDIVEFAIPVFHCYGHEGECQVNFSPRRKVGFGLTDGEMLERLWAFLRPFGKMTKEMRPSHRTDVLTDALIHYGRQTIRKLGPMLVNRMEKAIAMEQEANNDLNNLLQSFTERVDREKVEEWVSEELQYMQKETRTEELSWEQKYVIYLQMFYSLHERWQKCSDPNQLTTCHNQIQKIDVLLNALEVENNISLRWKSEDADFLKAKEQISDDKAKKCLHNLRKYIVERWFLLSLKSKYFEGQALASRLAKQINRVTKRVKKIIDDYNKMEHGRSSSFPLALNFEEIKDPDSSFWHLVTSASIENNVPFVLKRKAIDLYFMSKRCMEEKSLIEEEMRNTCEYYIKQHSILQKFIFNESLVEDDEETNEICGAKHFACLKLLDTESKMISLSKFSIYVNISFPRFTLLDQERDGERSPTVLSETEEEEDFSMNQPITDNEIVNETDSEDEDTDETRLVEAHTLMDSLF